MHTSMLPESARTATRRLTLRPDCQMLDAAVFCRRLVEEGSICAFLADHRHKLFKDEDFADLFPSGRGRPSIPVEVIWLYATNWG